MGTIQMEDVQSEVRRLREALISVRHTLQRAPQTDWRDKAVIADADRTIHSALHEVPTTDPLSLIGRDRAMVDTFAAAVHKSLPEDRTSAVSATRRGSRMSVQMTEPDGTPTTSIVDITITLRPR